MNTPATSILVLIALGCTLPGQAQQRDSTRYIVPEHMHVSGMGGLLIDWSTVNFSNGTHTIAGGGGGVLLDQRLMIGAYGMGQLESELHADMVRDGLRWQGTLNFEHAGFWTQWSFNHRSPVHPFVSLQLGWGEASWEYEDAYGNNPVNEPDSLRVPATLTDRIFVLSPSVGAEFNVFPWFRPNLSVGYRAVSGLALPDTRTTDLNGGYIALHVLFGGFGEKK